MEGDKIGMELGTHNVGKACGAYITKGCKANIRSSCFAYIVCA